jgi:hypothetical protein
LILEDAMRVDVSAEASEFVRGQGGRLWVWAAHPRMCCGGAAAYMHAAIEHPAGLSGFRALPSPLADLEIWFRSPAGRLPEVLEIGMRGKRRPRIEAYWDGCLYAL